MILSGSYKEMHGLLESVNRHAAGVGMCNNASRTKVMSAPIPREQRQAVLLDGEPLEDVDKFTYFGTEEIRSRINFARTTFSRLQSCL